jgi:hypothetical protein
MDQSATQGAGDTRPAGQELSDREMAREVADQTSSDLKVRETFRRESGGAASSAEVAETEADELAE